MAPQTIAVISGTARTCQHLTTQALANGDTVRAVVRSAAKFHATIEKQKRLTVYEADFKKVADLRPILDGVDVVYVALCPAGKALMQPTWLNLSALTAITAILHDRVAPGERSPTKVVLLSSDTVNTNTPYEPFGEWFIRHQFADLRAAERHLRAQESWLDFMLVCPGMIVDSEPSTVTGVKLQDHGPVAFAISYARLAAAMQLAAKDSQWAGKFVVPIPTEKVSVGTEPLKNLTTVMGPNIRYRALPSLTKFIAITSLGLALGYLQAARDGGVLLKRFGWN